MQTCNQKTALRLLLMKIYCIEGGCSWNKLDRVGPVDNTPSTDKPHMFVQKNKKEKKRRKKNYTCHLTPDMYHVVGGAILFKFTLSSSYGLGVMMFWRLVGKAWLN